jgi:hypothetical protein
VALRNVVIAPLPGGGGTNGVQLTGASSLSIEGEPHREPSLRWREGGRRVGRLEIVNSTLRNNGAWAVEILAPALAQAPAAAISGTQLIGNAAGIATVSFGVGLLTGVAITDTTISGPGSGDGLYVYDGSAASYATVMCIRCTIQGTERRCTQTPWVREGASIGVSNSLIMNKPTAGTWRRPRRPFSATATTSSRTARRAAR